MPDVTTSTSWPARTSASASPWHAVAPPPPTGGYSQQSVRILTMPGPGAVPALSFDARC